MGLNMTTADPALTQKCQKYKHNTVESFTIHGFTSSNSTVIGSVGHVIESARAHSLTHKVCSLTKPPFVPAGRM